MQTKLDEINLVTREKLTGIRVARAFGTEAFEETRFDRVNQGFMKNAIKMILVMGIMIPGLRLILRRVRLQQLLVLKDVANLHW